MKTWKKIEETKKKTGDILGLKRRNEDRLRKVRATNNWLSFITEILTVFLFIQRIYDSQIRQDIQRNISQKNYLVKRERVDEKAKVQEAIKLSKHEEAKQAKIMASQNEQKKRHHLIRIE